MHEVWEMDGNSEMTPEEWLTHDLNHLLGKLCHCQRCDDARSHMIMNDINLIFDCTSVEQAQARLKRGVN
jgi:hypothetical protein